MGTVDSVGMVGDLVAAVVLCGCATVLAYFVALATIESPYKSVSKSMRDIAASFDYKLGIVGGTLAIFLGKN